MKAGEILQRDIGEALAVQVEFDDEKGHEWFTLFVRVYPEGHKWRLQPLDPTRQPIYVPAKNCTVKAALVTMVRSF